MENFKNAHFSRSYKMKVSLFYRKADTGGDVIFTSLYDTLKNNKMDVDLSYTPLLYGYIPPKIFFKKQRFNGDIIHASEEIASIINKHKKPLIMTTFHCVLDPIYQKYTSKIQKAYHYLFLKRYIKKSLKNADVVTTLSENSKRAFEKAFNCEDIRVIYPGIETEIFKPEKIGSNSDKINLLFVGNSLKRKGFDLLPKIMNKLDDRFELWYTDTQRYFKDKRIKPIGRFKSNSPEMAEVYNKCDIFLFPTRLEGFGLCVGEAMACGKPVVTTNYSSLPELIVNEKGGYLCEMDNVNEFVERIKILAKDENLRKQMGKFNKDRVSKKFSRKQLFENHLKLYKEVI